MKLAILKASILFNKIGCNPFFARLVPRQTTHTLGGGKYVPQRATKSSTQALPCTSKSSAQALLIIVLSVLLQAVPGHCSLRYQKRYPSTTLRAHGESPQEPRRRRAGDKEEGQGDGGPVGSTRTRILGNRVSKEAVPSEILTCSRLSMSLSPPMSPAGPTRKAHTHARGAEYSAGHRAGDSAVFSAG